MLADDHYFCPACIRKRNMRQEQKDWHFRKARDGPPPFLLPGAAYWACGFGGFVMPAQFVRNPEMPLFAFLPRSVLGHEWL